jgi:putative ABC transport system ATP-binding protein
MSDEPADKKTGDGEKKSNGNGSAAATGKPIIKMRGLRKVYKRGAQDIPVLEGIDLDIGEGAFEALMGPSGSGKTTLLNIIAGIDRPSDGQIEVAGTDITRMSEGDLASWRARNVGFIFQFYNLLPVLTAFQNVELPLLLTDLSRSERADRVKTALRVVGLEDRMDHYPRQLSGGQEQRVAIARAIVTDPMLIVADEPTGDLDRKSAEEVLKLLGMLHKKFNKTIVMVTHDPTAAQAAEIVRKLDKGLLVDDGSQGAYR